MKTIEQTLLYDFEPEIVISPWQPPNGWYPPEHPTSNDPGISTPSILALLIIGIAASRFFKGKCD